MSDEMLRVVTAFVVVLTFGATSDHVFRQSGIGLRYPPRWFVTNTPVSGITNPAQLLVLSSYRLPSTAGYPDGFTPAPRGVAAVLMESLPPYVSGTWPARPRRFLLGRFLRLENFGGNRWAEMVFTDHKRDFYLFVGLGSDARPHLAVAALRILDRLVIKARAR